MMRPRITVVGSFAVGLTLRAPRFPVGGETLIGSDFDMGPGGKGSNQAVGTARLGAESHFVGVIGCDPFGDIAARLYDEEGVYASHLERSATVNTGVGFITLNKAGENHIILDPGANLLLTPQHVDAAEALIASSSVVLTVLEIRSDTAARAMAVARRNGVTTVLNPAPATSLDQRMLSNVDVLTPNESELRILLGLPPDAPASTLDLAQQLRAYGARDIVVTRGRRGALVLLADGSVEEVSGIEVEVTDTTGAGDAFTAALAMALAERRPLLEAARFAVCAGALACTRLGVIPALPSREAVDRLFQAQSLPGDRHEYR